MVITDPSIRNINSNSAIYCVLSVSIPVIVNQSSTRLLVSPTMTNTPLTGAALIEKVRDMAGAAKSDLARACGYFTIKKDGTERINFTEMYEALLHAQGLDITPTKPPTTGGGKAGRSLSYTTTIQGNNNLLVGKAYTIPLGFVPGDVFSIQAEGDTIMLTKVKDSADVPAEAMAKRPGRKSKSIEAAVEMEEAAAPAQATSEDWSEQESLAV